MFINSYFKYYERMGNHMKWKEEYELGEKLFDNRKYKEALDLFQNIYESFIKNDNDEEHSLILLNKIASCYKMLGNYKEQLKWNNECYQISKRVLGEEHPDTLTCLSNLAINYGYLGYHNKELEKRDLVKIMLIH